MKTRLKARKEEKTPSLPVSHGPCKVHVELDRTEVLKSLDAVIPDSELPVQPENQLLPPKVRILI